MNLSKALLKFLEQPQSYPHQPESIEHIQTHISHLFIVPPFVYKLKKPLDLEFLDFSTLEKRRYYCEKEVELNNRLCSDTYLGVVPIFETEGSFSIGSVQDPEGQIKEIPAEYAVKMKLLKKENFLIEMIRAGECEESHLEQVADRLESFYRRMEPEEEIQKFGRPEMIRVNTDENFSQTRHFISKTIEENTYLAIRDYTNSFIDKYSPLFEKRVRQNRIVDGHGDLHLEHINFSENGICIYDCIEFNRRFRLLDVAADLAFLAMDLDFNHLQKESRDFICRMSGRLDDPDLLRIVDFYKCYRAYIRGKVKSFESEEEEVPEVARRQAAEKAGAYFRLALCYSLIGTKPVVIIVTGRVGSGKSTLARHLEKKLNLACYSTDIIRKKMAGIPLTAYLPERDREKLYSPENTERTYHALLENGLQEIAASRSVILDGTFSRRHLRESWIRRFEKDEIDYMFIEAAADETVRRKRLQDRSRKGDAISDARAEDMEMLDRRFEDLDPIPPLHRIQADTTLPPEDTIQRLYRNLTERHLSAHSM